MTEPQIQLLDDLEAEFARIATEHRRAPRRGRTLALALGLTVLLCGAAYAVPATRATIDDLTGTFAGWVGGDDEQAPGRALRPDEDAPDRVRAGGGRVIAEAGGVRLYATRDETDQGTFLNFSFGGSAEIGGPIEAWRERLDKRSVVVLGAGAFGPGNALDSFGRVPLVGVTARSVRRVELRYAEGPPLALDEVRGGFVLLADAWRPMRAVVAYDAEGLELDSADVSHLDLRYLCEQEPACPVQ